jgi:hypothetical protein
MNSQFGEKLRTLREKQHLYLRQVAPLFDMDIDQMPKIEKAYGNLTGNRYLSLLIYSKSVAMN